MSTPHKTHVNPKNGEPGPCRAKHQCPWLEPDEHLGDDDEARKFYEDVMEGRKPKPLQWFLSPQGEPVHPTEDFEGLVATAFDEAEHYRESLSKDEIRTLWNYMSAGYESCNSVLRGTGVDPWGKPLTEQQEEWGHTLTARLDQMFESAPKMEPRVLYRAHSTNGRPLKEYLDAVMANGEFSDVAFMSTSQDPEYPLLHCAEHSDKFMIELVSSEGIPVQDDDAPQHRHIQSYETEVLLPRGKKFRVVGVEYRKKFFWGETRGYALPKRDWDDKPWEKKVRKSEFKVVPVLRLIEVVE